MSLEEIRALRAEGTLAARFPELAPLLATAGPDAVRRAGGLLGGLDPDQVLAAHPGTPVLDIALTGSATVAPLVPALTGELARQGLLGRVEAGDPGGYALALARPATAALTVCVLDAGAVFGRLPGPVWTVDDVATAAEELLALLADLSRVHAAHGTGVLVFTTAPLWAGWSRQILGLRERARLGAVWRRFTAGLLELGTGEEPVYVIDLEPFLGELAGPARDARLESYAQVPYTDELFGALARQLAHLARTLTGRPRKCLVLDLDGTLWGGTLAESGAEGLEMAQGYRGEAHRRFQRAVAQLGSQGVLLAVCSKNDPAEVEEVLATHPDLVLRREDFVTVIADWAPKADTVPQVAERIGIGADSLVFIDDSPAETGLVRLRHPGIAVLDVDAAEPAGHLDRLLAEGWFDTTAVTADDLARTRRYRTEGRRAEFRSGFTSLTDYLAELGTELELFVPGPGETARIAQLTQRTNQFNLTTRRLDEAAVRAALADPAVLLHGLRARDRFGDHGVVGMATLRRLPAEAAAPDGPGDGAAWVIEDLLMSCRVLGRGIESAWLGALLRWAAAQGAAEVRAAYRPTRRNARVATLYPDHGFAELPEGGPDEPGTVRYRHPLTALPAPLDHLTVTSALPAPAVPAGPPGLLKEHP
jgi:FkbH-like protein